MKNNNKPDLTILQQIEQLKIQRMKEMRSNKNKRNSGSTTSFTPKSSLTSKDNSAKDENNKFKNGKYSKRRRACIAYMESTVVDISIPPPSFKPVSLSLPRSSLSKTPKQVFF